MIGRLLVIEARMLGLDGRQSQFNRFVKQITEHLESVQQSIISLMRL